MKLTPLELLCILFIGLKLAGYIAWSWFWVLSPVLIPVLLFVFIAIVSATLKELD